MLRVNGFSAKYRLRDRRVQCECESAVVMRGVVRKSGGE